MKTVKSPAGDEITVMPDEAWQRQTGITEKSMRLWNEARRPLFGALWNHGAAADASGRATNNLFEKAREYGYGAAGGSITSMFNTPANTPAVARTIIGKRCYEIRLVALPEMWFRKLDAEWPHMNGHKAPAPVIDIPPEPTPEPTPTVELPDIGPALDVQIASSVAMALLTQVVEIISTGPTDVARVKRLEADFAEVTERLSARLSDNERMRKSIREMGDEIVALRHERDGLRQNVRRLEKNLEHASNVDVTRIVNERVQKELSAIMSARPAPSKGPDNA